MDDSLSAAAFQLVHDALNPQADRRRSRATEKATAMKALIESAIMALPVLVRGDVKAIGEELCSVCYFSYEQKFEEKEEEEERTVKKEEEQVQEMEMEGKIVGVTRVDGCGHLFCRECLVEWIQSYHGTCPKCRHVFLEVKPLSDSDDESSDGGEYVPQDDDEEEESVLNTDGVTEADEDEVNPVMEIDQDAEQIWHEVLDQGYDVADAEIAPVEDENVINHLPIRPSSLFEYGGRVQEEEERRRRASTATRYRNIFRQTSTSPLGSQEEVTTGLSFAVEAEGEGESSHAGGFMTGGSDMEEDTEDEVPARGPSRVWYEDVDDDGRMDVREFMEQEWDEDDPDDMDYEDGSSECGLTDDIDDASSEAGVSVYSMSESGLTMVDDDELKEEAEYFVGARSVPDSEFEIMNEGSYRYSRDKETES